MRGTSLRQSKPRLTYANVVATLALSLSMTGATAYAVEKLPSRSVGEFQLRPGAITASKLRKNAVITPKIKAKAITSSKLATSSVDNRILAPGSVTGDKLAYQVITHDKVAPDAITGDQIVESSLTRVPSASTADSATSAESANPLAFADIDANGDLNPNLSKGIAAKDVVQTSEGVYCITVPGFNPRGGQATARKIDTDGVIANLTVSGTGSCPVPKVEVQTYDSEGSKVSARFYVALYR